MKHHSQRSKRPPSRTLAPRILAALTAGAVTLGVLPCAYAANNFIVTSSVTEDIEVQYGVVGNIDGAPATITVGREGYGGTPSSIRRTATERLWSGGMPSAHSASLTQ